MCLVAHTLFNLHQQNYVNTTTLTLIKFADDMALVARLKDEQSLSSYFNFIEHLISWFDESYLKLKVEKTKELWWKLPRVKSLKKQKNFDESYLKLKVKKNKRTFYWKT